MTRSTVAHVRRFRVAALSTIVGIAVGPAAAATASAQQRDVSTPKAP